MSGANFSIRGTARSLAVSTYESLERKIPKDKREEFRQNKESLIETMAYNNKQIAFNAATVGMITAIAISALSFSSWPFMPALAFGFWILRHQVDKDLMNSCDGVIAKVAGWVSSDLPHENKEIVRTSLGGINLPKDWNPVFVRIAGLALFRSLISVPKPMNRVIIPMGGKTFTIIQNPT